MALSKLSVTAKRLADGSVQIIVGVTDASDDVIRSAISDALFHAVDKLGERASKATEELSALTESPPLECQIVYGNEGETVPLTPTQWVRVREAHVSAGRMLTRDEVLAILAQDAAS